MIKRIKVVGLFGRYDYDIPLRDMTFITGGNGLGKSTILRLLYAVFKQDWQALMAQPYRRLELEADGYSLEITRQLNGVQIASETEDKGAYHVDDYFLNVKFAFDGGQPTSFSISKSAGFQDLVPGDIAMSFSVDGCYYIGDQRLANSYDENGNIVYSQSLEKCRKDCRDNIHKLKLFVDDKLSPFYSSPFKADADKTEDCLTLYDNLVEWGLLNAKRRENIQFDSDEYRNVVTTISVLYQEIIHDKWMREMYLGLQNLLDIIDSYQYDNKNIELSLEHGFRFKTTEKQILRLNQLSSGEQHILLQVYELLFNAPVGSLVLVDEPETSQHLAWQMEYCGNMEKISNARHLQCLIATHLPQMFDNDFSRTVDLYTLVHPE